MKIVIVSAFRNAASYIEHYCDRMDRLQALLHGRGHGLKLVLGYGDSRDGSGEMLHEHCLHRFDALLLDVSHGGHHFGSIVHPQRFKQLAYVGNRLWQHLPDDADIVSLIESDLRWHPESFLRLVEGLQSLETCLRSGILLAPAVEHLDGRFYDTWAFRRNGLHFTNRPPFHPDLTGAPDYLQMDSVGSVLVMRGSLAKRLHWPEEDVIVGVCRQAAAQGTQIFMATKVRFYHP